MEDGTVIRKNLKAEKNTEKKKQLFEGLTPGSASAGDRPVSPRSPRGKSQPAEPMAEPQVSKPTLTYWEIPGRAEIIRLSLEVAGEDYDYNPIRYPSGDHWKDYKTKYAEGLTFGQIPRYQEPDTGLDLVQSHSILRHIARKYNMNGSNEKETSKIDAYYEGVQDFLTAHGRAFYATREKEKAVATFVNDAAPTWLAFFSKILAAEEKKGSNYLVGGKISYADLALFVCLKRTREIEGGQGAIEKFPDMAAYYDRLANLPRIKKFYESDPYNFKWDP